jgi:hypothetical protein
MRARGAVLLALCLFGCAKGMDPTTLLSAPPLPTPAPQGPGLRLHVTRKGDGIPAVINIWVEDQAGTANLKTLLTYNPTATYDCPMPSNCPIEYAWWPGWWALSNDGVLTDGNTSATVAYSADTTLNLFWDWKDHGGLDVGPGTWVVKAEVAGYNYNPQPGGEAHVTVTRGATPGTAVGVVDSGSQWLAISADWVP